MDLRLYLRAARSCNAPCVWPLSISSLQEASLWEDHSVRQGDTPGPYQTAIAISGRQQPGCGWQWKDECMDGPGDKTLSHKQHGHEVASWLEQSPGKLPIPPLPQVLLEFQKPQGNYQKIIMIITITTTIIVNINMNFIPTFLDAFYNSTKFRLTSKGLSFELLPGHTRHLLLGSEWGIRTPFM